MEFPELEKQLKELRKNKKKLVRKVTEKCIEAINKSEQAALTHMTLLDSQEELNIKSTKKFKKRAEI